MPDSADRDVPLDDDDARRLVVRAVAALVAFVLAAGLAVVLREAGDDGDDGGGEESAQVDGEPVFTGGPPLAGTDVPGYVVRRRAVFGRVSGRLVAVVSFDRYLAEAEARGLVEGVELRGLLVAAPGGSPAVVAGGLEQWADQERAAAESERENLERMAEETDDPAFVAQFQADQARLGGLLGRIDPKGPVVFGAVVEGEVAALRRVAGRAGVRLADPVARRAGDDEVRGFGGLRPEETAKAGDPPHRPF